MDQAVSRDEESLSYVYEVLLCLWTLMLDANCHGKDCPQYSTIPRVEKQLKAAHPGYIDTMLKSGK